MLYHQCNSQVKLSLSSVYNLISNFGLRKTSIFPTQAEILVSNSTNESAFYCVECMKIVPLEEVHTVCMNCGQDVPVSDAKVPSESNGVYCPNCVSLFSDRGEYVRNLPTILKKLKLQRG